MSKVESGSSQVNQSFSFKDRLKKTVALGLTISALSGPMAGMSLENKPENENLKNGTKVEVDVGSPQIEILETEEEKEMNLRFEQFLAGEGEYSDKNLDGKKFFSLISDSETLNYKPDLGFYDYKGSKISDNYFKFQGVLLGSVGFGGSEILAVGIKDRNGKRKVTLMELNIDEKYKAYGNLWVRSVKGDTRNQEYGLDRFEGTEQMRSFVNSREGEILLFTMSVCNYKDQRLVSYLKKMGDNFLNYDMDYIAPRVELNWRLAAAIGVPPKKILEKDVGGNSFIKLADNKYSGSKLISVESYADVLETINEGIENLPLVVSLAYLRK